MKDDTKRFCDLTAQDTAETRYETEVLVPIMRDLVALLPENARVQDLGCGQGHETIGIATTGAQVFRVDLSRECVRVATLLRGS